MNIRSFAAWSSLLLSRLTAALVIEEVGFATSVSPVGCPRVASTFVRQGQQVLFDQGVGLFDNATKSVNMSYPSLLGATGYLRMEGNNLKYRVEQPPPVGNVCDVDIYVMAGSVLGSNGGGLDSYGLYRTTLDEAASREGYPCKTKGVNAAFLTVGRMAAVDRFTGLYDDQAKRATFVIDMAWIMTVELGQDGGLRQVVRDGFGNDLCVFDMHITDGSILGRQAHNETAVRLRGLSGR